jgi:hypothetical protein
VPALNARLRNMSSGSIGDACRRSAIRKNSVAAIAAAPSAAGSGASQPCWPASMKPAVSVARAATPSSSPGTSTRRAGSGGDSGTYLTRSQPVSTQTGTLTRKIVRQPASAISTPPSTGPSATPSEPMAPQTPSARARAPRSGNRWTISAREQGRSAEAPRPCTARAAISTPSPGASAQAAEPAANPARPIR